MHDATLYPGEELKVLAAQVLPVSSDEFFGNWYAPGPGTQSALAPLPGILGVDENLMPLSGFLFLIL
jgi:hypothetical protein